MDICIKETNEKNFLRIKEMNDKKALHIKDTNKKKALHIKDTNEKEETKDEDLDVDKCSFLISFISRKSSILAFLNEFVQSQFTPICLLTSTGLSFI